MKDFYIDISPIRFNHNLEKFKNYDLLRYLQNKIPAHIEIVRFQYAIFFLQSRRHNSNGVVKSDDFHIEVYRSIENTRIDI